MQIVNLSELVYAEPRPASSEERDQKRKQILEVLDTPIYMGICTAVVYDHKSDRYAVASEVTGKKKLTLKATNEVGAYVAAHIGDVGYWQGRMQDGALVDVNLIQAG